VRDNVDSEMRTWGLFEFKCSEATRRRSKSYKCL